MRWLVLGVVVMGGCTVNETTAPPPPDVSLVSTSVEPPGANCPNGGVAISTGLDANHDGVLEPSEVSATTYACTAPNQLVRVVDEPPGAHCAAGGQAIESGPDSNGNGVLDDTEVTSTSYVCATAQPLIRLDIEPPGPNCVHGGTAVRSGLDVNNDGTLDGSEVTSTSYVCEPPSTLQQLVAIVPAGTAVCPGGGQTIEVGFDLDDDGVLDPGEISSVTNVCGGISTLVRVDPEPAGPHCAAGGSAILTGQDLDHDGVLGPSEVQSVQYVCNPSTTVLGDVTIHVQSDVDALAGVEVVAGTIRIDSPVLTTVVLPGLKAVGAITCTGNCIVHDLQLPALETITQGIQLQGSFANLALPRLKSGNLSFFGHFQQQTFSLPRLESGGLFIDDSSLQTLSLPVLHAGEVQCWCPLTALDVPAFSSGSVTLVGDALGTITLPAFSSGEVYVRNSWSTAASFPQLATGVLDFQFAQLVTLDLPHLTSGTISVQSSLSFHELDVPELVHLDLFRLVQTPQFPTCVAVSLWQALGFPDHLFYGTDDNATCP